jgi:prephenate dehydratase
MTRVAFLGPPGTFTEEALLTQPDLASADLVPLRSMPEVLEATERGEVDLGFVALENSIDGTVNESLDGLIFENELLIQREVVLAVRLNLLVPPGLALSDVKRVVSFPKAIAQCRGFLARELPDAEMAAANSTAEAVRIVGEEKPEGTAAVGTALAASLYGLDVAVADIEDHPENSTRFVLVAPAASAKIPAMTGHDKSSIVCFQHADRPGSLHAILGQFSARNINLTKLESRPTKRRLGHYCFIIDLEGHIEDEVVADCLRDLHAQLADLKFLGSEAAWKAADEWVTGLRGRIE